MVITFRWTSQMEIWQTSLWSICPPTQHLIGFLTKLSTAFHMTMNWWFTVALEEVQRVLLPSTTSNCGRVLVTTTQRHHPDPHRHVRSEQNSHNYSSFPSNARCAVYLRVRGPSVLQLGDTDQCIWRYVRWERSGGRPTVWPHLGERGRSLHLHAHLGHNCKRKSKSLHQGSSFQWSYMCGLLVSISDIFKINFGMINIV